MVLSRIILAALLALGSIAVALPVVPRGGVTGTTPTPGSGALSQGSLTGDGVPLENHNKELFLLLGGVTPQGNQASTSVSRTQSSSSAAGSSCKIPPLAQSNEVPPPPRPSGEKKADLLRRMALIKNHPNVHKNYEAQVERLANTLKQKEELDTAADRMNIYRDTRAVGILSSVIEFYLFPHNGFEGDSIEKLIKIDEAFDNGENVDDILDIVRFGNIC
ncbi:hypothetical protein F5051DRAFT_164370 [Lentinula edodes]|nr:hypothetical protein F5051DRAFT_164370 [Lentinula edodes]